MGVNELISTHTLTWSVTHVNPAERAKIYVISTHTLTWSVTNADETKFQEIVNFNSHAHVERDT